MLTRLHLHRLARPAAPHRHGPRPRRDHARLQGRACRRAGTSSPPARPAAHERRAARVGPALVLLALTRNAHRLRRPRSASSPSARSTTQRSGRPTRGGRCSSPSERRAASDRAQRGLEARRVGRGRPAAAAPRRRRRRRPRAIEPQLAVYQLSSSTPLDDAVADARSPRTRLRSSARFRRCGPCSSATSRTSTCSGCRSSTRAAATPRHAYEQLLATTYDALKTRRPEAHVDRRRPSRRAAETTRRRRARRTRRRRSSMTSATRTARAVARSPLMDIFSIHVYSESPEIPPSFRAPATRRRSGSPTTTSSSRSSLERSMGPRSGVEAADRLRRVRRRDRRPAASGGYTDNEVVPTADAETQARVLPRRRSSSRRARRTYAGSTSSTYSTSRSSRACRAASTTSDGHAEAEPARRRSQRSVHGNLCSRERAAGQYVAYTFFRVDPAWRRLPVEERAAAKDAFADVVEEHGRRGSSICAPTRRRASARTRTSSSGRSPSATRTSASSAPRSTRRRSPAGSRRRTRYLATTQASQYTSARKAREDRRRRATRTSSSTRS